MQAKIMSNWAGIDEFLAVASTNSFTAGAKILGVSVTHTSRAVKALELRLRAELFHRTTRSVRLTDTGRIFYERCEHIVQERDEAIASITAQGEPQGELRVTCSTAMGERFVAPLIRRFAMAHERLNVSIDLSNRVVDIIGEGFDLAIRTGSINDGRLIATRVASRRLLTCAASSYIARAGRPRHIGDLASHACLIGSSLTWHYQVNDRPRSFKPSGRFRCNSGHAVIEACVAGSGICQLPDFYIMPYLKSGMVETLLDDYQPQDEPIWAVYPQTRHLMPKVELAVECLKHGLGPAINSTI